MVAIQSGACAALNECGRVRLAIPGVRITKGIFLIFVLVNRPQPAKEDVATPLPSEKTPTSINQTPVETNEFPQLPEGLEKKPIVLKFSAMIDGIAIGAALLPSLKAEYKMGRMRSHGMTGNSPLKL